MKPWERQEKESEPAFQAFLVYLNQGVGRSSRAVGIAVGKSEGLIERWCSRWSWVARIQAHTDFLAQTAIEARAKETAKQARKIITADEVLEHLTEIAVADWREFVELKHGNDGEIINANLRLGDKLKALELVGKYHKLFGDTIKIALVDAHSFLAEAAQANHLPWAEPKQLNPKPEE